MGKFIGVSETDVDGSSVARDVESERYGLISRRILNGEAYLGNCNTQFLPLMIAARRIFRVFSAFRLP
jgi:hypothetical protein